MMKNHQNKNLPLVSIIIPCRNEEKFIKKWAKMERKSKK